MGILYIVSTPIGNLDDITIRAIKTLLAVDYILCEDTRRSGILLSRLKELVAKEIITTKKRHSLPRFLSFHQHNEEKKIPVILNLLKAGRSIALVSDAGTPLLSDPGYPLVRECVKRNIPVIPVPGVSSILAALVASGLPPYPFIFLGYPPEKSGKRRNFFTKALNLLNSKSKKNLTTQEIPWITTIFFASPHKIVSILTDFITVFGDVSIVVARELTKIHEEFIREKASTALRRFKKDKPKGELTILFKMTAFGSSGKSTS